MILNVYCKNCDNIIRIRLRPFVDFLCQVKKIRRSWVALSEALRSHDWEFDDFGVALCPRCSKKDLAPYTGGAGHKTEKRNKADKQFQEDQQNISPEAQFAVWLSPRDAARFRMAVFFVNQNLKETTEFLFKQFADHVLCGNLREKSEAHYKNYIEDIHDKELEQDDERKKAISQVVDAYFSGKDMPAKQARLMAENLLKMNQWDIRKTLGDDI